MKQEIKDTVEEATGVLNEYELEDLATAIMKVVMSRLPSEDRIAKTLQDNLWMAIPYDPIKKHLATAIRSDLLKAIGER